MGTKLPGKKLTVIIRNTESFWESLCKDAITFVALALCVWVSRGSAVWEIVTALMFVGALAAWVIVEPKQRTRVFKSEKELAEWLQENIISKEQAGRGVAWYALLEYGIVNTDAPQVRIVRGG